MIYHVIKEKDRETTTALLFHDPSNNHYFIKSKSEVFRKSFYAAMHSVKLSFKKDDDLLVYDFLSLNNPIWSKRVLSKACGSFWYISETKETDINTQVDDVVNQYL